MAGIPGAFGECLGFREEGLGFREGLGFKEGLGFRGEGLGFRGGGV